MASKRQHRRDATPPNPPLAGQDDLLIARARQKNAPMFTLVGWDRTAPEIIRQWAIAASKLGAPAVKVGTALIDAVAFEEYQRRHGSKIPD